MPIQVIHLNLSLAAGSPLQVFPAAVPHCVTPVQLNATTNNRRHGQPFVFNVERTPRHGRLGRSLIGPIPWGHGGSLCHALSLLLSLWTSILHCHSPGVATVARRLRYSYSWLRLILVVVSTVTTPDEWQCKIRTGGVRRLAVANGPNIFQMLLVYTVSQKTAPLR